MSFFTMALIGGPADSAPVFKDVTAIHDSGMLLLLPKIIRAFLSDVTLFLVLQGCQFDYRQVNLADHRSLEIDWDNEACIV